MICIVTGGLGFIGSNLTDKLIELGHTVVVIDNLHSGKLERLNPKAKWVNADITDDLTSWFRDHERCDVIFHLSALVETKPSFDAPIETSNVNVIGTMRVLELAKKLKSKLIYAGSSPFYSDPHGSPYAMSKWLGEEMCVMYNQVYNVPVAIARFSNVYGPRQSTEGQNATVIGIFERQKNAKEALTIAGTGEQRRDFTHVRDIVNGLIAMSSKSWNGEIFNLGSGVNYSIKEVVQLFEAENVKHIPKRSREEDTTLVDIQFTTDKLGWLPIHSLDTYVHEFLDDIESASRSKKTENWLQWFKRVASS